MACIILIFLYGDLFKVGLYKGGLITVSGDTGDISVALSGNIMHGYLSWGAGGAEGASSAL